MVETGRAMVATGLVPGRGTVQGDQLDCTNNELERDLAPSSIFSSSFSIKLGMVLSWRVMCHTKWIVFKGGGGALQLS